MSSFEEYRKMFEMSQKKYRFIYGKSEGKPIFLNPKSEYEHLLRTHYLLPDSSQRKIYFGSVKEFIFCLRDNNLLDTMNNILENKYLKKKTIHEFKENGKITQTYKIVVCGLRFGNTDLILNFNKLCCRTANWKIGEPHGPNKIVDVILNILKKDIYFCVSLIKEEIEKEDKIQKLEREIETLYLQIEEHEEKHEDKEEQIDELREIVDEDYDDITDITKRISNVQNRVSEIENRGESLIDEMANVPSEEINKLDTSYLRPGRISGCFKL